VRSAKRAQKKGNRVQGTTASPTLRTQGSLPEAPEGGKGLPRPVEPRRRGGNASPPRLAHRRSFGHRDGPHGFGAPALCGFNQAPLAQLDRASDS
jgi:hypothetical protein